MCREDERRPWVPKAGPTGAVEPVVYFLGVWEEFHAQPNVFVWKPAVRNAVRKKHAFFLPEEGKSRVSLIDKKRGYNRRQQISKIKKILGLIFRCKKTLNGFESH